jgi:hypothetical protein
MDLSPFSEDISCAATQEIPSISWNPKVHYCVHKSLPLVPVLSQISPVRTTPSYLCKIHCNIIHPPMSWSSQWYLLSFLLSFPSIFYMHSSWPIRATCPAPLILLDLKIVIILGKWYKLGSSSLCSFLHYPDTLLLFGPNIHLSRCTRHYIP